MINQHEPHVPTNTFKRCLSNVFNSSHKQKNESRRINLSTVSNDLEPIFTTWMTLPEITTIFDSQSPTYFLPFKMKIEIVPREALKAVIKYDKLLDGIPEVFRSKLEEASYKKLPNIQADDFGFVYNDNTVIKSNKVYYDDCTLKIITLQENQQFKIDRAIEQVSTDDLSTTAKNTDSPSSIVKSELKAPEIRQQQSQDLFETLQQFNTMMKTQRCMEDAAKLPAFSKIGREISQI